MQLDQRTTVVAVLVLVLLRFIKVALPSTPNLEDTLCQGRATTPVNLSLVEEVECLHPSMNTMTKLLHQDLPLPPPYINLGMPKAGSSTLYQFFRCKGVKANHWKLYNKTGDYVGGCIHQAVMAGLPPLKTCDPYVQAWMQLDVIRPDIRIGTMCFFPQMQYLEEIHAEAPNATFILMFRPLKHWVKSINHWRSTKVATAKSMGERLTMCDLPGLPKGTGADLEDYARWFCRQVTFVRDFVARHPSHNLVEINLYDDNSALMSKLFQAPQRCWGHANANKRLLNTTATTDKKSSR